VLDQQKMAGRGDGKKLGDSFNDSQKNDDPVRHAAVRRQKEAAYKSKRVSGMGSGFL
jgi:hypothetical protein